MDEEATFEARSVLAPRRARLARRLALLVPVVAFVAVAWAGLNGAGADPMAATGSTAAPGPTASVAIGPPAVAVPSRPVEAPYPTEVIGLAVERLGELQLGGVGLDDVVAVAGWYVPTAITDCPTLPAIYRDGALPFVRGDADASAFCIRSGLLYASRPGPPSEDPLDVEPPAVAVTVVVGVIMPLPLQRIGNDPTAVVVVGRFGKIGDGCRVGIGCTRELLVDHVAWTRGV